MNSEIMQRILAAARDWWKEGRRKERRGDVGRSRKEDIFIILLVNTSKMRGLLRWIGIGTISLRMRDFIVHQW